MMYYVYSVVVCSIDLCTDLFCFISSVVLLVMLLVNLYSCVQQWMHVVESQTLSVLCCSTLPSPLYYTVYSQRDGVHVFSQSTRYSILLHSIYLVASMLMVSTLSVSVLLSSQYPTVSQQLQPQQQYGQIPPCIYALHLTQWYAVCPSSSTVCPQSPSMQQ